MRDMDPSSVLCSCFSPAHERLALLLGVQLKHSLRLHMCLKTQLKHREGEKLYMPHSPLINLAFEKGSNPNLCVISSVSIRALIKQFMYLMGVFPLPAVGFGLEP